MGRPPESVSLLAIGRYPDTNGLCSIISGPRGATGSAVSASAANSPAYRPFRYSAPGTSDEKIINGCTSPTPPPNILCDAALKNPEGFNPKRSALRALRNNWEAVGVCL